MRTHARMRCVLRCEWVSRALTIVQVEYYKQGMLDNFKLILDEGSDESVHPHDHPP